MRTNTIYAVIEQEGTEAAFVFNSWEELFSFTFSPARTVICALTLNHSHGKNYHERKANAHNLAIQYSNNQAPGLSWGELSQIQTAFETLGKRYGLLKEFRENAII